MSTIHYSTAELSNVLATLVVFRDGTEEKQRVAAILARCSTVNTYAALTDGWPASETAAATAEEIARPVAINGNLERACSTMAGMVYNCNGLASDKLKAEIGGLLSRLMSMMLDTARDLKERNEHLANELRNRQLAVPAKRSKK